MYFGGGLLVQKSWHWYAVLGQGSPGTVLGLVPGLCPCSAAASGTCWEAEEG